MHIRKAIESDFERIAELHNFWSLRNLGTNLHNGFLLLETTIEKIRGLNSPENIILVAVANDEVVGYLLAVKRPELLDSLNWSESLKNTISEQPHHHISEMAVDEKYIKGGVGRKLYAELIKQSCADHFSAYVATAPYRNQASISFHEKIGFRSVATFHSKDFCGIENYSSTLLYLNNPKNQ